jgi:endoglucanase
MFRLFILPLRAIASGIMLSLGLLGLVACGGGSSGHSSASTATSAFASSATFSSTPASTTASSSSAPELTMLHTDGAFWAKADGTPIHLKGTNIGNWLVQEFWMMGQGGNGVIDQCTLEKTLIDRFSYADKEATIKLFRDSWFTARDWDQIQAFGFNIVRIPIHWNVIEDDLNFKTLRPDAWTYLDWSIAEAKKRGIYVILDLHGAAGGQTPNDHTGCSGKNEYWTNPENHERTKWLWQQIATKYKDEPVVAAYDPLNEPWGSTAEIMATRVNELYDTIRAIDSKHIVLLPSHYGSIDAYGDPATKGQTNVAFQIHPYPGLFGDRPGDSAYLIHRDWLRCGAAGTGGVCYWNASMTNLKVPLLVGEFQPWQSAGLELGGQIGRATYDTYAAYGWAATSWAYKLVSPAGGQGMGTWGMVTNTVNPNSTSGVGLVTKASTWDCNNWDSSFAEACAKKAGSITVGGTEPKTYYLVIKTGANAGADPDVTYDNVSILNNSDNAEVIINGNFGTNTGWTQVDISGSVALDFNYTTAGKAPAGSDGPVLHVGRPVGVTGEINTALYQVISLQGGQTYTFSGVFKGNNSVNTWAEIYLIDSAPVAGKDVIDMTGKVDFATASLADIQSLFSSYATQTYDVHTGLSKWLVSPTAPDIFNLPARPSNFMLVAGAGSNLLTWDVSTDPKVTNYKVYRSTSFGGTYIALGDALTTNTYTDTTPVADTSYFYKVVAFSATDESFASDIVSTGVSWISVPATIQAEDYTAMSGLQTEACSDTGGGQDVGYFDAGDFMEFKISVATAGDYTFDYRLATQPGSSGFEVLVDDVVVDTQAVATTGGWQTWVTVTSPTIALTAGNHTLRFNSVGKEWNINWLSVNAK